MYQLANVDDTMGFMAAARALTQKSQSAKANGVSEEAKGAEGSKGDSKSPRRPLSPCAPEFVPSSASSLSSSPASNFNPNAEEFVPVEASPVKEDIGKLSSPFAGLGLMFATSRLCTGCCPG